MGLALLISKLLEERRWVSDLLLSLSLSFSLSDLSCFSVFSLVLDLHLD
jgi:hypothetical protein